MDKKHCAGCRNDYYNDYGECWQLIEATMENQYAVKWNMPMTRANFKKVRRPSCYFQPGMYYYVRKEAYARLRSK